VRHSASQDKITSYIAQDTVRVWGGWCNWQPDRAHRTTLSA